MNKFTDILKAALEKKHAAAHPDSKTNQADAKFPAPHPRAVIAAKPTKKVTGRGR